jgi:hypothetical protein
MNALANFPITAVQFGASRLLAQAYERAAGHKPDATGRVGIAMGAGAASALLSCPAEFLVIHQQKTGRSLRAEAGSILKMYGPLKLYKGLVGGPGPLYGLRDSLRQHFHRLACSITARMWPSPLPGFSLSKK